MSLPVLPNEDKHSSRWVTDWARDYAPAESEGEDGAGSPAVCLRAGSHVERPNVLIGVSGNGRYLTRLINQSRVKRLEAWMARGRHQAGAVRQTGPFSCLVLPPRTNPRHPPTPSQLRLSHSATQPQSAKWGCDNNYNLFTACSQHAWHKHGNVTWRQKHPLQCSTGTRSLLCRVCPSPFVMSNTAFSSRGHFEHCHTYLTTCHERPAYQQQHAQRNNLRHKHTHIYKNLPFGPVHQTAAIVKELMFFCTKWKNCLLLHCHSQHVLSAR